MLLEVEVLTQCVFVELETNAFTTHCPELVTAGYHLVTPALTPAQPSPAQTNPANVMASVTIKLLSLSRLSPGLQSSIQPNNLLASSLQLDFTRTEIKV